MEHERGRRERSYPLAWRREKLRWVLVNHLKTADLRDIADWLIERCLDKSASFGERMQAIDKLLQLTLGKEQQTINVDGQKQRENVLFSFQQIMSDPQARNVVERMADSLDVDSTKANAAPVDSQAPPFTSD